MNDQSNQGVVSGWINPTTGETGHCDSTQSHVPNPWYHRFTKVINRWMTRRAIARLENGKRREKARLERATDQAAWEYSGGIGRDGFGRNHAIYINHRLKQAEARGPRGRIKIDYNVFVGSQHVVEL